MAAGKDGNELVEPERIGRYRIIEQLGRGGFATVYLCEDRGLDDRVAVKLLAENHSAEPESVRRFVAEARVMRNLRTPGVVTVHDVGEHDGRPYFVMEYCERGTLSDRLRALRRRITLDEAVGLAGAISSAMVGLHGSEPPVVHRDIKPDNLLIRRATGPRREPVGDVLGPDEELIVGDFGLAKVVDLQSTKMSLIAYTRGFAPPEQVRGHAAIQPSADVYSASAVLIAAISGEAPEQVFADGEPAFTETALAATGPLRQTLQQGIRFTAEHRQPNLMMWADALATVAAGAPTPSPSSAAPLNQTVQVDAPTSMPSGPAPISGDPPVVPPPSGAAHGSQSFAAPHADLGSLPPPAEPPSDPSPSVLPHSAAANAAPGNAAAANAVPANAGLVPDASPPTGQVAPSSGGRSTSKVLIAVLGVLAVVAAGVIGFVLQSRSADTIIGPDTVAVGQEAAFFVAESAVVAWEVGGQRTDDPVLLMNPTSTGRITIRAITADGEQTRTVEVSDADDELTITGPAYLTVGETVELSVTGSGGAALTWRVSGEDYQLQTLEIRPAEIGTFEVQVRSTTGALGRRTFTVGETAE